MLMSAPNAYPNMRIAAPGGRVVAEEGFRTPDTGIMIPLLWPTELLRPAMASARSAPAIGGALPECQDA